MKTYNFDEIIDREQTDCVKYDLRPIFFGSNDLIPMWVADMDFKTPDFIVNAIKKRAEHEIFGYSIRTKRYYDAFINWVEKLHHWSIKKEWILYTSGVVPAVSLAIEALTKPGEKIIIQPPVYFPFANSITNLGRQLVINPLKEVNNIYVMNFEHLRKIIDSRTKMLILSNPHNPGGRVWTPDELKELCNICEENNIILFSDEIHSDIVFSNHKHTPVATVSETISRLLVTAMAPTKTFNMAGIASSSIIVEDNLLRNNLSALLETMHLSGGNVFSHEAAIAAYTYGENWLKQMNKYVEQNIDFVSDFLLKNIPEIVMMKPEGTYMIWLNCKGLRLNEAELKDFFINKTKVGLNQGITFGEGGAGFFRMNVACPQQIVHEALRRIKNAVLELYNSK